MDATSNSKTTADPIAEALAEARKQCRVRIPILSF